MRIKRPLLTNCLSPCERGRNATPRPYGNKAALPAVLLSSDTETGATAMQTDFLLNQQSARGVNVATWRDRAWTHEAPTGARRPPFDSLTIGLHWVSVVLVL